MYSSNLIIALLGHVALFATSDAYWKMPCAQWPGAYRVDPIVTPGKLAMHAHSLFGASNINTSTSYDDLRASPSTSCAAVQDKSAYWVPTLYFQHANGTFEAVPQPGGVLVYYLPHGDYNTPTQAFPAGFRMISGNLSATDFTWPVPDPDTPQLLVGALSSQQALQQRSVGFNCLHYNNPPNEDTLRRHALPSKDFMTANCHDGLRLEIAFPSCWNGKDVDSDDHQSHMRFSSIEKGDGTCPEGFEHRLPYLMFENVYYTQAFYGMEGEFMLANGDRSGLTYHADFMNGWDPVMLQQLIDDPQCGSRVIGVEIGDCPLFDLQPTYNKYAVSRLATKQLDLADDVIDEDCANPGTKLCGHNKPKMAVLDIGSPISYGDTPVATTLKTSTSSSVPSSKAPASDTTVSASQYTPHKVGTDTSATTIKRGRHTKTVIVQEVVTITVTPSAPLPATITQDAVITPDLEQRDVMCGHGLDMCTITRGTVTVTVSPVTVLLPTPVTDGSISDSIVSRPELGRLWPTWDFTHPLHHN